MLGSLRITLPDGLTAKLESDKTRALLVYLAVQTAQAHRREALIGMLWPDFPEESARHNLRQALFNLRKAIGDHTANPPYLFITRDEIQFNPASSYTLDLAEFDAQLAAVESHAHSRLETCAVCAPHLQKAVDLYRGKFLQEFFLENSAEFEEWALARREATHQRALDALTHLADYYEQHGDLAATRRCAVDNIASVVSTQTPIPDTDDATVPVARNPALNIVKNAVVGQTADVAGELIQYTITVQNTGNITLTGVGGADPNAEVGSDLGPDHRKNFPLGTTVKVAVLAIEEGGKRIRLSRARALVHDEQAETQSYLSQASQKVGGFGLTLGEVMRQSRRR